MSVLLWEESLLATVMTIYKYEYFFCNLLDSMASTVLCVNDWVLLFKMHLVMNSIVEVLYSSIISILKGKNNWSVVKLWLTQFHLDQSFIFFLLKSKCFRSHYHSLWKINLPKKRGFHFYIQNFKSNKYFLCK